MKNSLTTSSSLSAFGIEKPGPETKFAVSKYLSAKMAHGFINEELIKTKKALVSKVTEAVVVKIEDMQLLQLLALRGPKMPVDCSEEPLLLALVKKALFEESGEGVVFKNATHAVSIYDVGKIYPRLEGLKSAVKKFNEIIFGNEEKLNYYQANVFSNEVIEFNLRF